MKRFIYILFVLVATFACDDSKDPAIRAGRIKFKLQNLIDKNGGRAKVAFAPASVVLSVEDNDGHAVYENKEIQLFTFGASWVSDDLEMAVGSYQVTKFLVLNGTGNVIAATPLQDSELAHLVTAPLPVDFEVLQDVSIELNLEVVQVQEEMLPESFGYVSFSLTPVVPKRIKIRASIASSNFSPATAVGYALSVTVKDAQGNVRWNHAWDQLPNIANIIVPGGQHQYNFVVSKEGHIQHAQYYSGNQIDHISQLKFELIPENSTEILKFSNLNGLGINYYLPADPCLRYARVDFPESFFSELTSAGQYMMVDRSVYYSDGLSAAPPDLTEVVSEDAGFAESAANVWLNYTTFPALSSEDQSYCSMVPETDDQLTFQALLMIYTTNQAVVHLHEW